MYATVQDWEKDLEEIAALVDQVAALEGKLSESAANLLKCLELDAAGGQKLELAYNYAQRLFDQDQKNTKHQAMTAKVMNSRPPEAILRRMGTAGERKKQGSMSMENSPQ